MPGVIDDIMDFLGGSKALKKAAGTDTPAPAQATKDCPTCNGSGQVIDMAAEAQKAADRAKAAKQPATPAKAAPKKTTSLTDMMEGNPNA